MTREELQALVAKRDELKRLKALWDAHLVACNDCERFPDGSPGASFCRIAQEISASYYEELKT